MRGSCQCRVAVFEPLGLPENTEVKVVIMPIERAADAETPENILAIRPKSPKITPEQFDALVKKHAVSVGTLTPDFSREDIYRDHD